MRLTPEQLGLTETPETTNTTGLQQALKLAKDGWHVFPLRPGSKAPLFPSAHKGETDPIIRKCRGECGKDGHGAWDGTTDLEKIRNWWTSHPNAGIGANLGDDRIAFDVDINHGGQFLNAFPTTRKHLSGRNNGNAHLIYRYEPGTLAAQIKPGNAALGPGMDIKVGRGSYIVMPGTRHEETGHLYTVADDNAGVEHHLTDEEVQAIYDEAGVQLTATARGVSRGLSVVPGGLSGTSGPRNASQVTGSLSELLSNPPARGDGKTNEWLTRVAGHYAKMHRTKRDLYEIEVRRAAAMVDPNYEDTEKVLESIWQTEIDGHPERAASLNTGWLVGNGNTLFCQISQKIGDETIMDLAPYADFDLEARGVAITDTGKRAYWVRLLWRGQQIDVTLDGEILGDDRAIRRWLAGYGATIDQPLQAYPKTAPGVRLQRYLESQNPPEVHIVDTLGWHPELNAFVTHDGIITKTGPVTKQEAGIVADPRLLERDIAPYHYGFEQTEQQAREVLQEILTYQTEQVTSTFGAWWAACLLKPQIQTQVSIFPFFGVEAASESGKTNGFFQMMVALNGNTRGQIAPTPPVLRDSASANHNGIVWADDLDDLTRYGEHLRASTSNGTASKMDSDKNGIRNTKIVSPILISGEQLGMSTQKALADRAVIISVPSPTERMSLKNPGRKQWDDIVEMTNRYSGVYGLAVLAGWYQQYALQNIDHVYQTLAKTRGKGKGRHGDKLAVLITGAHLLDAMLGHENAWEGEGPNTKLVRQWATTVENNLTADNTLTMEVLPWALRQFSMPEHPHENDMGRFAGITTPAFIRGEWDNTIDSDIEIWISSTLLADAWARDHNHRVDQRTATNNALNQQADRVCIPGSSKGFKISGTNRVVRYRKLTPEYAQMVMLRATTD